MNRRNVLTGLGGLAISGGALFGTGAFTSVSAERAVEVNVLGGSSGTVNDANNDDAAQKKIADSITEDAADVLVDLSSTSIGVKKPDDTVITDGSKLYPSPDSGTVYTDSDGNDASPFKNKSTESQYVSLVANDVTIVFGSDVGLPRASDISYDNLFAFADPSNNQPTVYFATPNPNPNPNPELLTKVDGSDITTGVVSSSSISNGGTVGAEVATGTKDGATERLDIGIGEDPTA